MSLSSPELLILFIVPIVLFFIFSIRKSRKYKPFTPRARWKRIAGAVVCTSILASLTIGTWRSVLSPEMIPSETVLRPTMPPPVVKADDQAGYSNATVEPCQIILRVYLVRNWPNNPTILCGKSSVISWPDEAHAEKKIDLSYNGVDFEFSQSVASVEEFGVYFDLRVSSGIEVRSHNMSRAGGGVAYLGKGNTLTQITATSKDPLSLWPKILNEIAVTVELELASKDDPLESIAVSDATLLPPYDKDVSGTLQQYSSRPYQPPGIAMLMHWGLSSFLVLIAACAGSFAFHRAVPAFACLLAAAILYAGGLERFFIYRLDKHARDAQRPLTERVFAIERMTHTFFHPQASKDALNKIAADMTMPEIVRRNAVSTEFP